MTKKKFVLDTNVILHDSLCLYNFEEHDIFIPMVVLEELDTFKKGDDTISYHARNFVRHLSKLSSASMLNGGLSLGEGKGKLRIRANSTLCESVKKAFINANTPDHHILNLAINVAEEFKDSEVVLVSKDLNLRMKAGSFGITHEDYTTDSVDDIYKYKGHAVVDDFDTAAISRIYSDHSVDIDVTDFPFKPYDNQYIVLRNGSSSVLCAYNKTKNSLTRVYNSNAYGITPKNVEQTFALDALLNDDIPLVALSGKAGTGKTLLAVAAALQCRSAYRKILVTRPIVPLSNRDIGALPGDINDKIGPYMQPLFDNLAVVKEQFQPTDAKFKAILDMLEFGKLAIEPLAFIRGRSLARMYMVVDESQNLTPHEVKTIITRAGEGTKIIFTGDVFQIDHPYLNEKTNGLSYLIHKMIDQDVFAHVDLKKGERSRLADLASDIL